MDARPLFPLHEIPFEGFSTIEADSELRRLLAEASRSMLSSTRPPGLEEARVREGLVVSGDQFLSSSETRNSVLENLPKACAVDMESAAVAQVCRAAGLPLGVMRVISDSADGSAHIDFAKFVEESASKACAETVRHALRALAR
jgi:adenosylhomocysteine nucleosidase